MTSSIETLSFITPKNPTGAFETMRGKNWILYFYPKDNTPGCTQEALDFKELYPKFLALNADILGISRDSTKSHENFTCLYDLPFQLVSDSEEVLCKHFDVIKKKNLYGRISLGIERSTFLVDEKGTVRKEWRKVKVNGHAEEVLQALKKMHQN